MTLPVRRATDKLRPVGARLVVRAFGRCRILARVGHRCRHLDHRKSLAIVVGVILGTVAANLMMDLAVQGFCNAGEAVLVADLIERWFGRPFAFDDVRRVLGFVAAACLGAAASALGGAATAAPYWDVWRAWFLSDGGGPYGCSQDAQLAPAGKAALVRTYAYDVDAKRIRVSEGYAAIHGLPEGTTEIPHRQ